jgi:hypothetical protein
MVNSTQPKRSKPNFTIQTLPPQDIQALQRVATILNTSVTRLLKEECDISSQRSRHDSAHYFSTSITTGTQIDSDDSQTWVPPVQYGYLGEAASGQLPTYNGQFREAVPRSYGTTTDISDFALFEFGELQQDPSVVPSGDLGDVIMGHNSLPNDNPSFQRLMRMGERSIGSPITFTATPAKATSILNVGGSNGNEASADAIENESSDTSSQGSEHEISHLDAQPWETVSLTDPLGPTAGSSTSEILWIEDNEGSQPSQKGNDQAILNLNASYMIQNDGNALAVSPLRQKSRGAFQDQNLRAETRKTRALKACVRCRMQRVRVRYSIPPNDCQSNCYSATLTRMIPLASAKHVKWYRKNLSREFILFLAFDIKLQSALCIE